MRLVLLLAVLAHGCSNECEVGTAAAPMFLTSHGDRFTAGHFLPSAPGRVAPWVVTGTRDGALGTMHPVPVEPDTSIFSPVAIAGTRSTLVLGLPSEKMVALVTDDAVRGIALPAFDELTIAFDGTRFRAFVTTGFPVNLHAFTIDEDGVLGPSQIVATFNTLPSRMLSACDDSGNVLVALASSTTTELRAFDALSTPLWTTSAPVIVGSPVWFRGAFRMLGLPELVSVAADGTVSLSSFDRGNGFASQLVAGTTELFVVADDVLRFDAELKIARPVPFATPVSMLVAAVGDDVLVQHRVEDTNVLSQHTVSGELVRRHVLGRDGEPEVVDCDSLRD